MPIAITAGVDLWTKRVRVQLIIGAQPKGLVMAKTDYATLIKALDDAFSPIFKPRWSIQVNGVEIVAFRVRWLAVLWRNGFNRKSRERGKSIRAVLVRKQDSGPAA